MPGKRNRKSGMSYGYVRTAVDSFESTARQIRAVTGAARRGVAAHALIVEHATGTGPDRPGLKLLMDLATQGVINEIGVQHMSRLSRGRLELAHLLDRLGRLGVRVTCSN